MSIDACRAKKCHKAFSDHFSSPNSSSGAKSDNRLLFCCPQIDIFSIENHDCCRCCGDGGREKRKKQFSPTVLMPLMPFKELLTESNQQ